MPGYRDPRPLCSTTHFPNAGGTLCRSQFSTPQPLGRDVNTFQVTKSARIEQSGAEALQAAKGAVGKAKIKGARAHGDVIKLVGVLRVLKAGTPSSKPGTSQSPESNMKPFVGGIVSPRIPAGQPAVLGKPPTPNKNSSDHEEALGWKEFFDIASDSYERIEDAVAAARYGYLQHSRVGILRLEKLVADEHRNIAAAMRKLMRMQAARDGSERALAVAMRKFAQAEQELQLAGSGRKQIFGAFFASFYKDVAADRFAKASNVLKAVAAKVKDREAFEKVYERYLWITESFEKFNKWLERLDCVLDVVAIAAAAKQNKPHQILYKGGDLVLDVGKLAFPPLVLLKWVADPYLHWVQEQIEKHPDVEAIVKAHPGEFYGKDFDTIVREHSGG